MRRLHVALLVTAQLCGARTPGFSVHSDLLAHPQVRAIPGGGGGGGSGSGSGSRVGVK